MKAFFALAAACCLVPSFGAHAHSDDTLVLEFGKGDVLSDYNAQMGSRLASLSLRRDGYASASQCYYWAAEHMEDAGVIGASDWSRLGIGVESAYMFAQWANANPSLLRSELSLKRVDTLGISTLNAPRGSILVYAAGACGYSARHGHIEIVADSGYACSDFCHSFKTEAQCGGYRPSIYIPIK